MKNVNRIQEPERHTPSTFLVGDYYFQTIIEPQNLTGPGLTDYLHRLLKDPLLERKLAVLKSWKWKKVYQEPGQDLKRLNFTPIESDWARISMICNATGFSRCYIFVFLMLIDQGVIKLDQEGIPPRFVRELLPTQLFGRIFLDETAKMLTRVMQT